MKDDQRTIVFYDGICGLCNRTVWWLIRRDRKRVLRYAALQSAIATRLPDKYKVTGTPGSIVLQDGEKFYDKSTAVIRILARLKGIYRLAAVLYLIPRPARDVVYDWIARNRYRWFGKYDACPMPRPEHRELFLG